jgi:phosphatidylserine decarboxylase
MNPRTAAVLQHVLPQRLLCAFIYKVSRSRRDWIKRPLIGWFARRFAIDLDEAANADLESYASFNDFFTRAIKGDSRPIDAGERTLVAPADGRLTQLGPIVDGRLVQAKGIDYSLTGLLGEDIPDTAGLGDGEFATIYLAPHNYHRVHAPLAGRWVRTRYIPGDRYSVNATTAAGVRDLFCRNERIVCWFESSIGTHAVVLIGALNVSSMSTVTRGEIVSGAAREWREDGDFFAKGDEIGRFNLGSTVVLVLPGGSVTWHAAPGAAVKMGAAIAELAGER